MAGKKGKRGSSPPKDETKEQRFVRVASARVAKAVKAINNIAHCASINYAHTSQQVIDINRALQTATENVQDVFDKVKAQPSGFRFTETE